MQQHQTEILNYHNIHVVYTKEAETADQYIEKFAHEHAREYRVRVATSDGLEQIIIRGQGCGLVSAKELWKEIQYLERELEGRTERGAEEGQIFSGGRDTPRSERADSRRMR